MWKLQLAILINIQISLSFEIVFSLYTNFPGENSGVDWHFLLHRIFPTQGSNPGLPHCRQILYHLSHHGALIYWRLEEIIVCIQYILYQVSTLLFSLNTLWWANYTLFFDNIIHLYLRFKPGVLVTLLASLFS